MKTEIRSLKRETGQGVNKMNITEYLLFMSGEICSVNICLQEFSFIINSFGGAADSIAFVADEDSFWMSESLMKWTCSYFPPCAIIHRS